MRSAAQREGSQLQLGSRGREAGGAAVLGTRTERKHPPQLVFQDDALYPS